MGTDFADDQTFISIRKNFFLISILLFALALSNPALDTLTILNVKMEASSRLIYIGLWVAFLYYLWRYLHKFGRKWSEFTSGSRNFFFQRNIEKIRERAKQDIIAHTAQLNECSQDDVNFKGGVDLQFHDHQIKAIWNEGSITVKGQRPYNERKSPWSFTTTGFGYFKYLRTTLFSYIIIREEFAIQIFPLVFALIMVVVGLSSPEWSGNPLNPIRDFFGLCPPDC